MRSLVYHLSREEAESEREKNSIWAFRKGTEGARGAPRWSIGDNSESDRIRRDLLKSSGEKELSKDVTAICTCQLRMNPIAVHSWKTLLNKRDWFWKKKNKTHTSKWESRHTHTHSDLSELLWYQTVCKHKFICLSAFGWRQIIVFGCNL